jgi:Holliday junction resolvase
MKINSRQKGANGELEVCKLIKQYGFEAIRSQQHCGAAGDEDIIHNIPEHFIECKRYGSPQPDTFFLEAFRKALMDNKRSKIYICIFYRWDRRPWMVFTRRALNDCVLDMHIPADQYLESLQYYYKRKEKKDVSFI